MYWHDLNGRLDMCGRFIQKSERRIIAEEFYVQEFVDPPEVSYNVAPGQNAGVILGGSAGNVYARYRWGLVPSWAKDPAIGNRMINARSETISEKPSYRNAFRKRRCLVPVDGFYEWKKDGSLKVPFFIHERSGKPFSLAGLWETWSGSEGNPLLTFTILTTEANERLKELHDRMPVIIPPGSRRLWLDSPAEDAKRLFELLRPSEAKLLDYFEVSRFVNSPQNNSPECVEPVKAPGAT
jgi:putative SOS response-associated peptidase YedK